MKLSEVLKKTGKELNCSMSTIAKKTDQTPQNLSMKLKRDTLSYQEFVEYMGIMGAEVELRLVMPGNGGSEGLTAEEENRVCIERLKKQIAEARTVNETEVRLNAEKIAAVAAFREAVVMAENGEEENTYFKKMVVAAERLDSLSEFLRTENHGI